MAAPPDPADNVTPPPAVDPDQVDDGVGRAALDVAGLYTDIRRLVCAHPSFKRAVADGFDDEDLVQEIFCRLVARQRGRSAYDPSRSSLGRYVWMVTSSVVSNFRRDRATRLLDTEDEFDIDLVEGPDRVVEAIRRTVLDHDLDEREVQDLTAIVAGEVRRTTAPGRRLATRLRVDHGTGWRVTRGRRVWRDTPD